MLPTFFFKIPALLISIPARLLGMKMGANAIIFPGYRILFTSFSGVSLGDDTIVSWNAWFHTIPYTDKIPRIRIGNNCRIGHQFVCSAIDEISIDDGCLISYDVSIIDHNHKFGVGISPVESGVSDVKKIHIERNCFIGAHSFILKGVHLGENCVVGANSVVTKSFPPYSVIAGNPAKIIKTLKPNA